MTLKRNAVILPGTSKPTDKQWAEAEAKLLKWFSDQSVPADNVKTERFSKHVTNSLGEFKERWFVRGEANSA